MIAVPAIADEYGIRRPALPEGIAFSVLADYGDTMEVEADLGQRLDVDRTTIPADGQTYVVASYLTWDTTHFVVDGQVVTVEPVDGYAELEIAADAPGPIRIEVATESAVIVAEEVT